MSTTPTTVAIETPRQQVRAGKVLDERVVADARTGPTEQLLVDVDGSRWWVDAADTATPDNTPR